METKSAVLGAAGMLVVLGAAFGALGIANADNQPAPAPSVTTSAPAEAAAPTPAPEPVVTETPAPAAEPAAEPAPVEPAPVYVAPVPAYVAPEPAPAPVYVAPATEPGQNTYYSKPTAPPLNGPDPIKNTGLYDQPVTGELYWNSDDAPK